MRLVVCITLFAVFVQAASFTSSFNDKPSEEENVDVTDFPFYWGDQQVLSIIINMSGTVARSFPRNAMYLDHLLTDGHITAMISALVELEDKQLTTLGYLLRELPPQRFDSIVSTFYNPLHLLKNFIDGYPNQESRWKKSLQLSRVVTLSQEVMKRQLNGREPSENEESYLLSLFLTAENVAYFPYFTRMICDLMKDRPLDIFHKHVRNNCIRHWIKSGEAHIVRKMFWEIKDIAELNDDFLSAFVGHGDEFVAWFKASMKAGRLEKKTSISIPYELTLGIDRWQEIKQFIDDYHHSAPSITIHNDERNLPIVQEINKLVRNTVVFDDFYFSGFDKETFLGKLAIAKPIAKTVSDEDLNKLVKGYPMELNEACGEAIAYGVYEPLENTISLLFSVDNNPRQTITRVFWYWYYSFDIDFEISIERFKRIMSIIKPHLTELILPSECGCDDTHTAGEDIDTRWHFLPLYEDMYHNMSDYWPEDLQVSESGYPIQNWIASRLEEIPDDEEWAREKAKEDYPQNLFSYACLQGWKEMAMENLTIDLKRELNHLAFTKLVELFGLVGFRNQFNDQIVASLKYNLGWIAVSSNYQLLEDYLDLYTPHFIASLCDDPFLKRRISLMLHLSYKTQSYLNNQLVEKNSLFFRDWVYYRLWSKNPADRKLLFFFHQNRIAYRRYYGADPIGWGRTLGLFGSYHPPKDAARVEDLHFESESEVKVEEVKDNEMSLGNKADENGGIKRLKPEENGDNNDAEA